MKQKLLHTALCLFLALLMLVSCTPKLKYEDGGYFNEKNGITYYAAPLQYQAKSYINEESCKIDQKKIDDIVLYPISDMDGERWLCTADYQVFYAKGENVPSLWEMQVDRVYINKTVNLSYTLATILNKEKIEGLINVYRSGVACTNSQVDPGLTFESYDLVYDGALLRFCLTYRRYSEDVIINEVIEDPNNYTVHYPGIPVVVETDEDPATGEKTHYAVYNFGKDIIYDRYEQRVYSAGDLLEEYADIED